MKHYSPENCTKPDCEVCSDLVDAGLVYGCDVCGKVLYAAKNDHIYSEDTGKHSCNDCLKSQLTKDKKDCYNLVLSLFIENGDSQLILDLKRHFEIPISMRRQFQYAETERGAIMSNLSTYPEDIIRDSLDTLIKVFNIRVPVGVSGFSGTYTGAIYASGNVIP